VLCTTLSCVSERVVLCTTLPCVSERVALCTRLPCDASVPALPLVGAALCAGFSQIEGQQSCNRRVELVIYDVAWYHFKSVRAQCKQIRQFYVYDH
jgi:hypothetical protein